MGLQRSTLIKTYRPKKWKKTHRKTTVHPCIVCLVSSSLQQLLCRVSRNYMAFCPLKTFSFQMTPLFSLPLDMVLLCTIILTYTFLRVFDFSHSKYLPWEYRVGHFEGKYECMHFKKVCVSEECGPPLSGRLHSKYSPLFQFNRRMRLL